MKTKHHNWLMTISSYIGEFSFILLVLAYCIYTLYLFPGTTNLLTDADIIQLPTIFLDQRKIQIATVDEQGKPYIWNNNKYWYTDSWSKPDSVPQFQFIFMRSLDENAIISRYGNPNRIEVCKDDRIWWYDDQQAIYSNLMQEGL